MQKNWLYILVEFAAIVFGVLLALALSEWRGTQQTLAQIDRIDAVMIEELRANYEAIDAARAYHLGLLGPAVSARDAIEADAPFEPVDYFGFGTATLNRAGYQTALASAAFSVMEPERAASLVNAYARLDEIDEVDNRHQTALATADRDGLRFFEILSFGFSDLLYAEDAALQAIAPLIGETPPDPWFNQTAVSPY